jgi:hypothetical protein
MTSMSDSAAITGRCLCGRVRFQVSAPLLEAEYCHCKRCQRRTGTSASASALTAPGTFRVTEGEELLGAFKPDGGWRDHFCRECGSDIYAQSDEDPRQICVPMGAIDGDPGVRPTFHQYVAYAAPWDRPLDDGLPRFDEGVPSDTREG